MSDINEKYYETTIRVPQKTELRLTESNIAAKARGRTQKMQIAAVRWGKSDYKIYKSEKAYEIFKRVHDHKEDEEDERKITPEELSIAMRDDEATHKQFAQVIDYLETKFISFYILYQGAEVDPFPRSSNIVVPFSIRVARALGRPVRRKVKEFIIKADFANTERIKQQARLKKVLAGSEDDLRQSSRQTEKEDSARSASSSSSSGESSSLLEKSVTGPDPRPTRVSPPSTPNSTLNSISEDDEEGEDALSSSRSSTTTSSPKMIPIHLPKKKRSHRRSTSFEPKGDLNKKVK